MGRLVSGRGLVGVRALVGLTAFSEQSREQCQDIGWSEPQMRTSSGCCQPHETVVVGMWVDRFWDVVWSGDYVGQLASGRRSGSGKSWSSMALSCRSDFVGNRLG